MTQEQFIDDKMPQLREVCRQWDYLNYNDVEKWLTDNFQNDIEGKYYAIKILLHTIYYKKKDLEKLLHFGLYDKIYGKIIKDELITNKNIYINTSEAEGKIHNLKQKTFFIPLLDSNKPSESGNTVIGDLVHKLGVNEEQVAFHRDITKEKLQNYSILIFVDDCVGSGNQLKKFWNSSDIKSIREISEELDIKIYYLVQIGYDKNLELLRDRKEVDGLEVVVCDVINDKNKAFSEENTVWDRSTNEKEKAIQYFERLGKERNVTFLGYKKLDFMVILHDRLPNWSLPIFWKKSSDWNILLNRKTS